MIALLLVNVSTFETIITGFERINRERTKVVDKLIVEYNTVKTKIENLSENARVNDLDVDIQQLIDDDIRLLIIGDRTAFDDELQALFAAAEQKTSTCSRLTLTIAVNYGGRQDILNAARAVLHEKGAKDRLDQHDFEMKLNTRQLPDVDLLVRTGGEKRLSNFLLWEMSYAELYFTDVLWPDFTTQDLSKAIKDYYSRDRRYGGDPAGAAGDLETSKRA